MSLKGRKFNSFQRTMLQWDSMHCYNAVHVVRIPAVRDLGDLALAINKTLEERNLARIIIDQDQRSYAYTVGPACGAIDRVKPEGLAAEIERQLNTRFVQQGSFSPFRFFVAPDEDSALLGLAYLHAVADAESIVLLLKQIVANYAGVSYGGEGGNRSAAAAERAPNWLVATYVRKLAALPGQIRNLRSSVRPVYRNTADGNNGFRLISLAPESVGGLVKSAKGWGITVNDLLLAILLKCCALFATGREPGGRRRKISVGSIVNTRRDLGSPAAETFGVCLGSFVVTHEVPERMCLRDLARDLSRTVNEIKSKQLYLATALELFLGALMLSFFSRGRRHKLYPQNYPLYGGLTNMNINSLWKPLAGHEPLAYVRAVSTGPITPLVVSFTTAGDSAAIGVSYRSTVFSDADINRFTDCILTTTAGLERVQ